MRARAQLVAAADSPTDLAERYALMLFDAYQAHRGRYARRSRQGARCGAWIWAVTVPVARSRRLRGGSRARGGSGGVRPFAARSPTFAASRGWWLSRQGGVQGRIPVKRIAHRSQSANARSRSWPRKAGRTWRSPAISISAKRPSKSTLDPCTKSSASLRECSSRRTSVHVLTTNHERRRADRARSKNAGSSSYG